MARRSSAIHLCLSILLCLGAMYAAEGPVENLLRIHPAADGSATFWLISPALSSDVAAQVKPPVGACEGQPVAEGNWRLYQTDQPFTNLSKDLNGAQRGSIWCAARFRSTGGLRTLALISPLAGRVFLNGKEVLSKKAAVAGMDDYAAERMDLPAGDIEVSILIGVKYGQSLFRLAVLDAQAVAPLPDDLWLLPTKGPPDAGNALGRALSVRANTLFLEPAKGPILNVGLRGARPACAEEVALRILGPDGKALPIVCQPLTTAQLQNTGWQIEMPPLKSEGTTLDLICEFRAGERVLEQRPIRFFQLAAVQKDTLAFAAEVKATREQTGRRLPLAELTVEKLELWSQQLALGGGAPSPAMGQLLVELMENGRADLAAEAEGRDPRAQRQGYFERAYISAIDESPQPYFVLAPSAAKKAMDGMEKDRRFPLVLFLHGYVPDYHKHHWWTEMPEFNAVFEKNDCFLAIPFGRSNADFQGPGEVDVLDVLNEMKRLYPIDDRRVYLYGYSMGGMGVYSIAGHYPHLWAGAIVLAGHAESPLTWYTPGLDKLAPFKQHLIRTDQAIDQCDNFVNIPVQIFHGENDTVVKPSGARAMQAGIQNAGGKAELTFSRGDHWSLFDLMASEPPVKKMLEVRQPESFTHYRRTFRSLRFGDAALFAVLGRSTSLDPFRIEWTRQAPGYRIDQLEGPIARLGSWSVKADQPVTWPTKDAEDRFAPSRTDVRSTAASAGTGKTPLRCGPVKESTYGPFMVTYGTTGGETATAKLKKRAEDFAQWWYDFAKGRVAVKADRDVTEEDRKSKSLFIFGEEQEHLLHAEAAPHLPFRIKNGVFTAGERTAPLKNRGVMYIYPSPFEGAQPHCALVITAGAPYGPNLPVNHRLDLVPDFLLFEEALDSDGTKTNKPVLAGFFDGEWKLNPATTWWTKE